MFDGHLDDEGGRKSFTSKYRPVASTPTLVDLRRQQDHPATRSTQAPGQCQGESDHLRRRSQRIPKLAKTIERIEKFVESHSKPR